MYSYGSSARVGVGRRGPGGRDYRPPKERDPTKLVPPPLKGCDCMVQLDIPEYASEAAVGHSSSGEQRRRLHLCFAGSTVNERRKSLETVERELRSSFGVHLVVPGRNQKGPLAVVGKTYKEILPAVDFLMQKLVFDRVNNRELSPSLSAPEQIEPHSLKGKIMRNVKDPNDVVLSGRFLQQRQASQNNDDGFFYLQPYWLFQSDSCNTMVCPLSSPAPALCETDEKEKEQQQGSAAVAEALQIGFDNLRFRLGNHVLSELDIFLHPPPKSAHVLAATNMPPKAFATGDPSWGPSAGIHALYKEIRQTRVNLPENNSPTVAAVDDD